MEVLRSYVVRIYRHESDGIAGVIESVETGDTTPFRSSHELWGALSNPPSKWRPLSSKTTDQEGGK